MFYCLNGDCIFVNKSHERNKTSRKLFSIDPQIIKFLHWATVCFINITTGTVVYSNPTFNVSEPDLYSTIYTELVSLELQSERKESRGQEAKKERKKKGRN